MNPFQQLYEQKKLTPEDMARQFHDGDVCVSNGYSVEPRGILRALSAYAKAGGVHGLKYFLIMPIEKQDYMAPDMEPYIRVGSHFLGPYDRKAVWKGRADYIPSHYSQIPSLWLDTYDQPDVFFVTVSPMDKHGYFSLGTTANLGDVRWRAKKVFVEVNPHMPRTFGSSIHVSEVDGLIENDAPLPETPPVPVTEKDLTIGRQIAGEIPNGATIQLGIGGIPNAVAECLSDKHDLGIHSEMFCDSMVDLYEKGIITNRCKTIHRGRSVVTFAAATARTHAFIDDNPAIEFLPVNYVNNPSIIAQHDHFMSINSCMEIDLFGQVCSETIGPLNYSGTGGQVDFIRGAMASKGGKSFLAFASCTHRGLSKIRPTLNSGACVTTTRNDIDYVVTEYGMVRLKGLNCAQRAKALIGLAHPKYRDMLTAAAKRMHIF